MLDAKILSAKTESAEGAWKRDLRELGHARGIEQKSRGVLQEKQAAFWQEVTRRAYAASGAGGGPVGRADHRVIQAHRELRSAVEQHRSAQQGVQRSSDKAARSESMFDLCKTMLGAERRRRAGVEEGRRGDEVQDTVTFLRARGSSAGGGGPRMGALHTTGRQQTEPNGEDRASLASMARPHLSDLNRLDLGYVRYPDGGTERINALRSGGSIEVLSCERSSQGARLTVECRCGPTSAPITVALSQSKGEGVHVVVMARDPESVGLLVRERSGMTQRLQAAGVKVDRLTVEQESSAGPERGVESGVGKRRRRGDDDEDRVA